MKKSFRQGGILLLATTATVFRIIQSPLPQHHYNEKLLPSNRNSEPIQQIFSNPPSGDQAAINTQQHDDSSYDDELAIMTPPQEQHLLSIEKNSTITPDIVKIWHETDSKSICVALKQDARCPNPALLGRLSGPALAVLEWKERKRRQPAIDDENDHGTVLCGSYGHNWLEAGYYFVEIIILYCKDFGVTALQRTKDRTAWLNADHTLQCVEDSRLNRITAKEGQTIVRIPTSVEGRDSYHRGHWIRKQQLPLRALFTRHQPLECAGGDFGADHHHKRGSPMQVQCSAITDRDRDEMNKRGEKVTTGLYEYEFQWNMQVSEEELVEKLRQRQRSNSVPKICAIGDSHSRYMVDRSLPLLNLTGLFHYINHAWIDPDGITDKIAGHNCDVFFVQVGQYPASFWSGGHPFSFGKYYVKLKQHVQNILKFNPNATVYLPTIDQAPLMARINNCSDWRTPTMLDGYSYVNQMIEHDLQHTGRRVKYIDTNFIIYTHWDGHPDWQHLMEIVRTRKTIYMAAIMLGAALVLFEWH